MNKEINLKILSLCYAVFLQYLFSISIFTTPIRLWIIGTSLLFLLFVVIRNFILGKIYYKRFGIVLFSSFSFYALLMIFLHHDVTHFALGQILTILTGLLFFSLSDFDDIKQIINYVGKTCLIMGAFILIGSFLSIYWVNTDAQFVKNLPLCVRRIIEIAGAGAPRYNGLSLNPNRTSAYLMVTLFFCCYFAIVDKRVVWRLISLLISCFSLVFMVLVSSRTSIFSVGIFLFVFIIFILYEWSPSITSFIKKVIIFLLIIICLSALLICLLLFSDSFNSYVFNVLFRVDSLKTATGRTDIWKRSLNEFKKQPLFGVSALKLEALSNGLHNHNIFIQILTTTGIVGICLYISLIGYSLFSSVMVIKKKNYLKKENRFICYFFTSTLIALLVHGCFEQMAYAVLNIINIVITVVCVGNIIIYQLVRKKMLMESNT